MTIEEKFCLLPLNFRESKIIFLSHSKQRGLLGGQNSADVSQNVVNKSWLIFVKCEKYEFCVTLRPHYITILGLAKLSHIDPNFLQ